MSSSKSGKFKGGSAPQSLSRAISPPAKRRRVGDQESTPAESPEENATPKPGQKFLKSPFQLTRIQDLPPEANLDTVTLKDILGDPLISECWEFNYLHDIPFLKSNFDKDVRDTVKIHVIHGFWRKEDTNKKVLMEEASLHDNVKLHTAYLPEAYGTHHTKMIILFRRDDTAQVVIHTANMIPRDWRNMTQAVWRSPLLPLLKERERTEPDSKKLEIGTGAKFKHDLLNYLRDYDVKRKNIADLFDKLAEYDFSAVRGALIASVPGRHKHKPGNKFGTLWGWAAMKQALREIPVQEGGSEVVVQVSSIATLGPLDKWLQETLFGALSASKGLGVGRPKFKVVFPTADEIRRSADGYESGGSIHTKIKSPQQQKQLEYLRPLFHHWANDAEDGVGLPVDINIQDSGRNRAAPHIKTYVRYGKDSIDWALVTSANLSKQAWGETPGAKSDQMRICSYEIGVLVWPSLFSKVAVMKPTFKRDEPLVEDSEQDRTVMGFRMPYNLPLQRYGPNELPWVASESHEELDWRRRVWKVPGP